MINKNKIKVAYVFDVYPQDYQTYIDLLIEGVKNNISIDPSIYAFNAKHSNTKSLKYSLIERAYNKVINTLNSTPLPLYIKELYKGKFDIIHVQHSYLFNKFFNVFDNTVNDAKFVITLRGGDTYIKPWLADRWKMLYKRFGKSLFFVTVSEHQKSYLKKWGVPEEYVYVIPISHNNTAFIDIEHRQKDKLLKIASVFRMTWEKNIQGNLLFIKKLIERGLDVQYDIYGDGADLGEAYYLIDRFQLQDNVHIMGKVAYPVLMERLKNYHFILQLSISEALSSSILEAQSFGIPAIVSDSDGLPEAVIPGISAICQPFWEIDTIVEETIDVWTQKEKYISFCERSFENAQKFTVDKEVERLINMYQALTKIS